ncbi:MAG: OmpA family protein [Pseudomonadota bacterium]
MKAVTFSILALAVLAGCSNAPAGRMLDEGRFGNPTAANQLAMTGQGQAMVDLGTRFAQAVPTTVTFGFNSTTLDAPARQALAQQAAFMRQFPEVRFTVYGHTDAVGSAAYNQRLGLRRARAAVNYLVSQGVSRGRLEATLSLGETQPLVAAATRDRRNRRTVTEVSGFVRSNPLVMQGKYAEVVWREYTEAATESPEGAQVAIGGAGVEVGG